MRMKKKKRMKNCNRSKIIVRIFLTLIIMIKALRDFQNQMSKIWN